MNMFQTHTKAKVQGALVALFSSVALLASPAASQAVERPISSAATTAYASLLADSVQFEGQKLIASGHVDVLFEDTHLTASSITYDQTTGALTIEGPIQLTQGADGSAIVLASAAQLDEDLRNGVLLSARLVIDQQLQLASAQIDRIEGRYTRLGRTVTSACKVCNERATPLWQIRATEVIHDTQERQLYFSDAQFRLWDVPIFYLPKLRLPDPTLKRATGFLVPEFKNNSDIGTWVRIPYFIALRDDRDLTVTPTLGTDFKTLGSTYRQAYANGDFEINTDLTHEHGNDTLRGYVFVEGEWRLKDRWTYGFDLRATSDISYLLDYGIYDLDRLPSTAWVNAYTQEETFDAQLVSIETLREAEAAIEDTLPFLLGDASYTKNFSVPYNLGTAWLGASAAGHYRSSSDDVDGMDVLRLSAQAGWSQSYISNTGLRYDAQARIDADSYYIAQNSNYDDTVTRVTPALALRASYPFERTTATGAYQTLTPIVQLSWSKGFGGELPNSDSVLTEFDEGNLYAMSQFSGADRRGTGARAALGFAFNHSAPNLEYDITLGQIFSAEDTNDYSNSSGLSGQQSDFLVAAGLTLNDALSIDSRALFDTDLSLTKWETRFDLARERYSIGAVHAFVIADADEDRDADISEIALDGTFKLAQDWSISADYRYNFDEGIANTAGLELTYANECTEMKFSVDRRYTDTAALDPVNNYSFSVSFGAFGSGSDKSSTRCSSY